MKCEVKLYVAGKDFQKKCMLVTMMKQDKLQLQEIQMQE